jgi:prepilin-type N-terminal cleavage/methylation domain-containing protein
MKIEYEPSRQGFTLVEIMIVVAIIGLLAAIGIPSFIKARTKSLENSRQANCQQIESAIARYALEVGAAEGEAVEWEQIATYLRATDISDYDIAGKALDSSTFTVGGDVQYIE